MARSVLWITFGLRVESRELLLGDGEADMFEELPLSLPGAFAAQEIGGPQQ